MELWSCEFAVVWTCGGVDLRGLLELWSCGVVYLWSRGVV